MTAIENVSRGKRTIQSETQTYGNGTSEQAVDGNYNNMDLDECATLLDPRTIRSRPYTVKWEVDLGGLYAIVSVTIYNTAVLPGKLISYELTTAVVRISTVTVIAQSHTHIENW